MIKLIVKNLEINGILSCDGVSGGNSIAGGGAGGSGGRASEADAAEVAVPVSASSDYRFHPRRRVRPLIWRPSEWQPSLPAVLLAALKPKGSP